jgi:hypothetical protein
VSLSSDLISQFVKATKDDTKNAKETTVYGTIVYDGKPYVKIDGSDLLTPISTTADVKNGDRVTVMINNHIATVTGNMTSPSARTDDVKEVGSKITEMESVMAYKVTTEDLEAANATIESLRAKLASITNLEAVFADIETLQATFANLEYVSADEINAITANIESIEAVFGTFTNISTEELKALNADIQTLRGYTASFTYVSAEVLSAVKASIEELDTKKLSAEDANIKYLNVDFSNIDKAAMNEFYAKSGLIENVTISDGTVTGYLVGVIIKGDQIEANTLVADKLVIKGDDGLYYKLNFEAGNFTSAEEVPRDSLHGSIITAKSITATKISVDDLVAFDATIGGFNIGRESIYSGVKESLDNSTRGIYLGADAQLSIGNSDNFLRFYEDESGKYKLAISADSILFGSTGRNISEEIDEKFKDLKIGGTNLIRNSTNLIFEDYSFI